MQTTQGYTRALALLRLAVGPHGFVAATAVDANYRRVWARDSVICGLAGLMSGDTDLVAAMARTLQTLRDHQGPHGEIPSNVAADGQVSYGTLAGRADAPLWYVLGCAALAERDPTVLAVHETAMRQALWLCGAWEYNNRGLIYVPMGGSWADEYILHGYILHVQCLYLWALRAAGHALADDAMLTKARNLEALLRSTFWLGGQETESASRYHPMANQRVRDSLTPMEYWAAALHPGGYETMFDGLGNGLALLMGLGSAAPIRSLVREIARETGSHLTPAFYPPIMPGDSRWPDLERHFVYRFSNRPWEYHNGGLWPMVTGFMAAGLARCGEYDLAVALAHAIDRANEQADWGFFEFHHGRERRPMGVRETAWSAAAAVIAHRAARGESLPGTE